MKTTPATDHCSKRGTDARASRCIEISRVAREKAELALTPAERLTLALELSDLCADLAAAGRQALKERS
ncbi:MAG: hypothetical protein ACYC99_01075 [Candidatus Geothermincolia bacterium]